MTRINQLDTTAFVIATPTRKGSGIHWEHSVTVCSKRGER